MTDNTRERLIDAAAKHRWGTAYTDYPHDDPRPRSMREQAAPFVDAVLAALHPEVRTQAELDELPDKTAIQDRRGWVGEMSTVLARRVVFWTGSECEDVTDYVTLPARVLHRPDTEETR